MIVHVRAARMLSCATADFEVFEEDQNGFFADLVKLSRHFDCRIEFWTGDYLYYAEDGNPLRSANEVMSVLADMLIAVV